MLIPYDLTQLTDAALACPSERRARMVPAFEQVLSRRDRRLRFAPEEVGGLISFVRGCRERGLDDDALLGFCYSYSIPHISKELDLIKVATSGVLDIELKSQPVSDERVGAQLTQNEHFLRFLGLPVTTLTYCSATDTWRTVRDDAVVSVGWAEVKGIVEAHRAFERVDLDALFVPRNFLVSPVQDADAFLERRYFLTGQQEMARSRVLELAREGHGGGLVAVAETGTGKTLLLYDVARSVAEISHVPAAIVCGQEPSALHVAFDACCAELELYGPSSIAEVVARSEQGAYSLVGIDEAQLMEPDTLDAALRELEETCVPWVVAIDPGQGDAASTSAVLEAATRHVEPADAITLTRRLRANPRVADYVQALLEGRPQRYLARDVVDVHFAATEDEAGRVLARLERAGYHVIDSEDATHAGLEYDRVAMAVTGVTVAGPRLKDIDEHAPSQVRALTQGLLKGREGIALVVEGSWEVFERAVELLESDPA